MKKLLHSLILLLVALALALVLLPLGILWTIGEI
nr:MAG TPA: alpha/beta hydrolase family protein [Caudoviricetes sp.]